MDEEVFEKLKEFVIRQRWKYKFPLERTTSVENELDITGDDSVEFLLAYAKEFNVDLSEFMQADYFNGEGFSSLFSRSPKRVKKLKDLTLGDLEKGIEAGKLNEEVINAK